MRTKQDTSGKLGTQSKKMAATPPQIVLVPQMERPIRRFTGTEGHQELTSFTADIKSALNLRPDLTGEKEAAFLWANLGVDVREELLCQGVNQHEKDRLWEALKATYGDQRSLGALAVTFHAVRQEGYEDVRSFSTRLHAAYRDLVSQQKVRGVQQVDEAHLREQFVNGLRDPHIQFTVKQHLLGHPDEAFTNLRKMVLSCQSGGEKPAAVCAATAESSPRVAAGDQDMAAMLEKALKPMREEIASNKKVIQTFMRQANEGKFGQPPLHPPSTDPKDEEPNDQSRPRCYRCGQLGHLVRQCHLPPPKQWKPRGQNASGKGHPRW